MATVAFRMGRQASGDRQTSAPVQRPAMAAGAPVPRPRGAAQVLGVIELHVEAFFESGGEGLQWGRRALYVHMADGAQRHSRGHKLGQVTTGTGGVAGKPQGAGVVGISLMTGITPQARMPRAGVFELGVIEIGALSEFVNSRTFRLCGECKSASVRQRHQVRQTDHANHNDPRNHTQ